VTKIRALLALACVAAMAGILLTVYSDTQAQAPVTYPNSATFSIGRVTQDPAVGFLFNKGDGVALPNCGTGLFSTTLFVDTVNTTPETRQNALTLILTAKSLTRPVSVTYRVANGVCLFGQVGLE
jgi:hypothetical protein